MKLEEVSAVLRPRRSWEAVDLGCALVKRHSRTIFGAWMLTVFPLYVLISAVLWSHPVWALMLIVFLKPLADRIPLFVISRGMFGETPTVRQVVRAFPRMLWKNAGVLLFAHRFSLNRCFVMPVIELESSDKKTRKERISALSRLSDVAGAVTFFASVIEMCMLISLMVFTIAFIPESMMEEMSWSWWEFQITSSLGDLTPVLQFFLVYQIIALTLVEPFFVGAGFGLYLNARSILEGWDVELSFRRIAQRLNKQSQGEIPTPPTKPTSGAATRVLIGLFAMLCVMNAPPGFAEDEVVDGEEEVEERSHEELKAIDQAKAAEILEGAEFEVKTNKVWVPDKKEPEETTSEVMSDFNGVGGLIGFLDFAFWFAIVTVVALIVYLIVNAMRGKRIALPKAMPEVKGSGITTYQGMNIAPQSLPYDIAASARKLWEEGRRTEALGLLYRGAISWMVNAASLAIEESFTEGDCQRLVNRELPNSAEAGYFDRLTGNWVMTAYGQLPPSDEEFLRLCAAWPFVISHQPNGKGGGA